jgi:hypothetical protein
MVVSKLSLLLGGKWERKLYWGEGGGIDKDNRVKAAGTRKRTEEALISVFFCSRVRELNSENAPTDARLASRDSRETWLNNGI